MARTQDKGLYPPASDIRFAERFQNQTQVGVNGGTINGSPTIGNGVYTNDGTATNSLQYNNGITAFLSSIRTISFWYKGTSDTGQTIFSAADDANNFYYMGVGGLTSTLTDELISVISDSNVGGGFSSRLGYTTTTRTELFDGEWHHIVITMSGSVNGTKIYLDGAVKTKTVAGGKTDQGALVDYTSSITRVGVLNITGTPALACNGSLREFFTSDREYSAGDVSDLYNRQTYNYQNKAVLNLPMHDKIGASAPFTTSDLSGQGNDATLGDGSTASTFPTKLTHRNGYSFDGGDYMTALDITTDNTKTYSVSGWIDTTGAATQYLFDFRNGSTQGFFAILAATGEIFVGVNAGSGGLNLTGAGQYNDGVTHAYTVVFRPNGANVDLLIYVDGRLDASGTTTGGTFTSGTVQRYIGQRFNAANKYVGDMYGFIQHGDDEEITLTQHKDIYNKGSKYLGNR